MDSDGREEAPHDVAHEAGGAREDYHRILGGEAADARLGGLAAVYGEGRGGGWGQLEADAAARRLSVAAEALHRRGGGNGCFLFPAVLGGGGERRLLVLEKKGLWRREVCVIFIWEIIRERGGFYHLIII